MLQGSSCMHGELTTRFARCASRALASWRPSCRPLATRESSSALSLCRRTHGCMTVTPFQYKISGETGERHCVKRCPLESSCHVKCPCLQHVPVPARKWHLCFKILQVPVQLLHEPVEAAVPLAVAPALHLHPALRARRLAAQCTHSSAATALLLTSQCKNFPDGTLGELLVHSALPTRQLAAHCTHTSADIASRLAS